MTVDLLKHKDFQKYSTNLSYLREVIEANPEFKTIVIDDIQKLPDLLDEVHSLIFDYENEKQFILTGSSARKLRAKGVNLLAGRAAVRNFHPFCYKEIEKKFNLKMSLEYGMLPSVWNLDDIDEKKDYLLSYSQTYLKEEIQQEAFVRSLPSYLNFLEHFALRNGQVINLQNISNDIGVSRMTVSSYLEVLEQTLIGQKLLPIHLKAKVKEVSTPKFYFFDTGVVRTLAQNLDNPLGADKGFLLENFVLNELRCFSDYNSKRWSFFYWGTPSETEVDFIVCSGENKIGIEVKSTTSWDSGFSRGLNVLLESGKIKAGYGLYLGKEKIKKDNITIYPVLDFIQMMYKKDIFS